MSYLRGSRASAGFTLIEVLITLLIIAIGLLGLAGLQLISLQNQIEAYQRAQAIMLAQEMANRIRSNAPAARAGEYTPTPGAVYGLALSSPPCDPNTQTTAQYDLCDWSDLVWGQEVTDDDGTNVGSINGARGCIDDVSDPNDEGSGDGETRLRITVAWQGMTATKAPAYTCGQGEYGADDAFRRAAVFDAILGDLN